MIGQVSTPRRALGRRARSGRVRTKLAIVFSVVVLVAGCGDGGFSGLYTAPLPGGADLGENPYHVTVEFRNVLDLVPRAAVKVSDVPVGRVERIRLSEDTTSAIVEVVLNGNTELPANARAELRQSSLLGEKFVELAAPERTHPRGRLTDGATIPLDRTGRNAEVEEVLGALSLLLNGGGVEQLRGIVRELNKALGGNEAEFRTLLSRADHLATELDAQKGEIVRAIEGVDELSKTLNRQKKDLTTALNHLEPGLDVVADQREQLVGMLRSLNELSSVGTRVINRTRDDLAANLDALAPVLEKLAESGPHLAEAAKILPTYPLPYFAHNIVRGDYANVEARLDLNFDHVLKNLFSVDGPAGILDTRNRPETGEAGGGNETGDGDLGELLPLPESGVPPKPGTAGRDNGASPGLLPSLLGGTR